MPDEIENPITLEGGPDKKRIWDRIKMVFKVSHMALPFPLKDYSDLTRDLTRFKDMPIDQCSAPYIQGLKDLKAKIAENCISEGSINLCNHFGET